MRTVVPRLLRAKVDRRNWGPIEGGYQKPNGVLIEFRKFLVKNRSEIGQKSWLKIDFFYYSCWGYSLINTLKLKKKTKRTHAWRWTNKQREKENATTRSGHVINTRITIPTRGESRWTMRKSLHHLLLGPRLGMTMRLPTQSKPRRHTSAAKLVWLSEMTSTLWSNSAVRLVSRPTLVYWTACGDACEAKLCENSKVQW